MGVGHNRFCDFVVELPTTGDRSSYCILILDTNDQLPIIIPKQAIQLHELYCAWFSLWLANAYTFLKRRDNSNSECVLQVESRDTIHSSYSRHLTVPKDDSGRMAISLLENAYIMFSGIPEQLLTPDWEHYTL